MLTHTFISMANNRVLLPEEINAFFEKHKIPFQNTNSRSNQEIISIYLEAEKIDKALSGFILICLVDSTRTKFETNFKDADEMYECYIRFAGGLDGSEIKA